MRLFGLFVVLLVLVVGGESLLKPDPRRSKKLPLEEGADVGDPLYLTPLIEKGKIKKAQKEALVKPAIGNVTSYSGYLTTNDKCGNNIFFWFFPAQSNWQQAPVVTWLQGGPGASSLFGLFEEVGPFNSFPDGLQKRNYSWNVKNNLVFFDQPVGTGYSFTKGGCYVTNQTEVGEDMYSALTQFLTLFPTLQKNKFFIAGESYAGHFIPAIGHKILQENPSAKLKINLQSLIIGDGWTDPREQIGYGEYFYQTGFIDFESLAEYTKMQKTFVKQVDAEEWGEAWETWDDLLGKFSDETGIGMYNYLPQPDDPSNYPTFLQSSSVRKSIHVGNLEYDDQSDEVYGALQDDMPKSVKPLVQDILEQIPIIFVNGQVDIICGYPMTLNFIRSLQWSGQKKYLSSKRTQWTEGGVVAGYIKGDGNLYDVLVRDAGHMVPHDQPYWAFQLANYITAGEFPPNQ